MSDFELILQKMVYFIIILAAFVAQLVRAWV